MSEPPPARISQPVRLKKSEELEKSANVKKNYSFKETRVLEDMSDTTVPISEEEGKNAEL